MSPYRHVFLHYASLAAKACGPVPFTLPLWGLCCLVRHQVQQLDRHQQRNQLPLCLQQHWRLLQAFSEGCKQDAGAVAGLNETSGISKPWNVLEIPPTQLRTTLLLMLATARLGAWILEQPGNSCLEFYPAFRYFLAKLAESFGSIGAVGASKVRAADRQLTCLKAFRVGCACSHARKFALHAP